jgi:putative flippase GtrA
MMAPAPPRGSSLGSSAQLASLVGKHQVSSLVATGVDWLVMIAAVEWLRVSPVLATVFGAASGAIVNFRLGRTWTFRATTARASGQAWRYALVSASSLGLNALGVWVLASLLGAHYVLARLGTGLAVSLFWNFPLQRRFVFAMRDEAAA